MSERAPDGERGRNQPHASEPGGRVGEEPAPAPAASGRGRFRTGTGAAGFERVGYLGLGSNVGRRESHLRAAVVALREHGVEIEAVSSLYETEPVGEVLDQPDFLNAALRIRTELEPEDLLDLCKAIEMEQGRILGGQRHGPRPLDIDLLLLGDIQLQSGRLTLPHPQVTSRRFVLSPLLELDPDLALPGGGRLDAALERLAPGQRVRRVGALD